MSTRSTIEHVEHGGTILHLYYDCIEGNQTVYLEVLGATSVEASTEPVTTKDGTVVVQRSTVGIPVESLRVFLPKAAERLVAMADDYGMDEANWPEED